MLAFRPKFYRWSMSKNNKFRKFQNSCHLISAECGGKERTHTKSAVTGWHSGSGTQQSGRQETIATDHNTPHKEQGTPTPWPHHLVRDGTSQTQTPILLNAPSFTFTLLLCRGQYCSLFYGAASIAISFFMLQQIVDQRWNQHEQILRAIWYELQASHWFTCIAQHTMHGVQRTLYNARCTMHNTPCTIHNVQWTMHVHNALEIMRRAVIFVL